MRANSEDLKRFHGTNERLSVKNYLDAIRFYHRLMPQVAAPNSREARDGPTRQPLTA